MDRDSAWTGQGSWKKLMFNFDAKYLGWRKLVQKTNASRIRILRALEKDGCVAASETLGERPRYEFASRCNDCAGCQIMQQERGCGRCPGCQGKKGCYEYNRLCAKWDRAAINFHTSSVGTDTSSHFDIAVHDLSKYKDLVGQVKDAAIHLDMAVDDFPRDHPYRHNPRYSQVKLDADVENEEAHLSRLEELLQTHQEHCDRLTEVEEELWRQSEGEEENVEAVSPARDLTATATARQLQSAFKEVGSQGHVFGFQAGGAMDQPRVEGVEATGLCLDLANLDKAVIRPMDETVALDINVLQLGNRKPGIMSSIPDKLFRVTARVESRKDQIAAQPGESGAVHDGGDWERRSTSLDGLLREVKSIEAKLFSLEEDGD